MFKWIARRSKDGIPTISVVFGSSTAGMLKAMQSSDLHDTKVALTLPDYQIM